MTMEYHNPVLLKETVDGLDIKPDGVYVDVTFGGGGHSKEILKRLGPNGRLFAFDQDKDALANTIDDARFTLINENFSLEFGLSRTDAQFEELFDSNQCRFFAPGGASSFCVGDNLREFGDLKGNSPPQVPKNEATLALSYSTQVKEGVEVFSLSLIHI